LKSSPGYSIDWLAREVVGEAAVCAGSALVAAAAPVCAHAGPAIAPAQQDAARTDARTRLAIADFLVV
jgi:hypothetical protein